MADVVYRECNELADIGLIDDKVKLALDEIRPTLTRFDDDVLVVGQKTWDRVGRQIRNLVEALDGARDEQMDCPFSGDVEAQRSGPPGDQKLLWSCPLCGAQHEEVD